MPANRVYLLTEAGGDHGQYVPEAMVDSARLMEIGADNTTVNVYRDMINNSQARVPQADISATVTRSGNTVTFNTTVTNNSSVTLSTANNAAVHGIVYEDYRQSKTNFAGRGSARKVITSLAPGATDNFSFTVNLTGVVNPANLNYIVVVDYRTTTKLNYDVGVYDQLNAIRVELPFVVSPGSIDLNVKTADVTMPSAQVDISGIAGQTWTASFDKDIVLLSKTSGNVPDSFTVTVDKSKLTVGTQTATIIVSDGTGLYQSSILVTVNFSLSSFSVTPTSVTFNFSEGDPTPYTSILPKGDAGQTWIASANKDWVTMTPATGQINASFKVSVDPTKLSSGYQEAIVTVSDGGGYQSKTVRVKVTYTVVLENLIYLPLTLR
jgi:hypothetical protein